MFAKGVLRCGGDVPGGLGKSCPSMAGWEGVAGGWWVGGQGEIGVRKG